MVDQIISLRPSDAVEGGAIPKDKNNKITLARFVQWDYNGKAPMTTALKLTLVDDDGEEHEQYYSVASPDRFIPTEDGRGLVAVGAATNLTKSSNYFLFAQNLVSAGFPENKIAGDPVIFENLYAYWIGIPEPTRTGLTRTAEQQARGVRELLVPQKVLSSPAIAGGKGVKAPAKAAVKAAPPAATEDVVAADGDLTAKAVAFVTKLVTEAGGPITRKQVAARVFRDMAKDPQRDEISNLIFSADFSAELLAGGLKVKGEEISQ